MLIQYRTLEGYTITHDADDVPSIEDVGEVMGQYMEITKRDPEYLYVSYPIYADMQKQFMPGIYNPMPNNGLGNNITSFVTFFGEIRIKPMLHTDTPFLIGTEAEYYDNQVHKLFEEIVLKDFDRI